MKLSEIGALPSFALLGPGFSRRGGFTLVSPLVPAASAARVVFAAYEAEARHAHHFDGEVSADVALELDVAPGALAPRLDEQGHGRAVATIREGIARGDVYQVNHTLRARFGAATGAQVLASLCRRGVPRLAAWVRLPDGVEFVSASPELFFEIDGSRIRSEPMKGTAAREQRDALERSGKDRAELAMITDLVRNDLTPICRPRSVRVACERRFIELPYAVQAVSDVEGELVEGVGLVDVLAALHPGGSITGAPKNAARRFIAQLETSPRGAYCGALAYVDGERTTASLLIRTAQRIAGDWVYGVGGGIVWDSDAALELAEARLKLGALS